MSFAAACCGAAEFINIFKGELSSTQTDVADTTLLQKCRTEIINIFKGELSSTQTDVANTTLLQTCTIEIINIFKGELSSTQTDVTDTTLLQTCRTEIKLVIMHNAFRIDYNIFIKIRINIHNNNIKSSNEYGFCCGE